MTTVGLLVLVAACGGGGKKGEVVDWPPAGDYGEACPAADRVGGFVIGAFDGYSSVGGSVAESVLPITVLDEVGREGDCALFRKWNPFCDPPCAPGQLCEDDDGDPGTDGVCAPYPPNLDVGPVHVRGLVEDVRVEADVSRNYSNTSVPHPLFEPGAAIQLYAEGAQTETFSLDGAGVALLEAELDWTMVPDGPLDLTWTAWDGPARIWMSFNVDQHGNSPVTLVCEVPDTGSATVPASLVTQLFDFGISGAAVGLLRRRTVDSVQIAQGCVDLEVYSHVRGHLACDGCL